jgi:hypothetical protein
MKIEHSVLADSINSFGIIRRYLVFADARSPARAQRTFDAHFFRRQIDPHTGRRILGLHRAVMALTQWPQDMPSTLNTCMDNSLNERLPQCRACHHGKVKF